MINFHLSKLWKAKFFILCDVIFLVRLQGKFDIDHSWGRERVKVRRITKDKKGQFWVCFRDQLN